MRQLSFRSQDGSAIVTATVVMLLLMLFGMSVVQLVEGQQGASRVEREHESSFQLAEGVLSAQLFQLSTRWPGSVDSPYPESCVGGPGGVTDCPSNAALQSGFDGVDYKNNNIVWTTHVRDNSAVAASFYTDAALTAPRYDANGDGFLWVRSQAQVRNRKRTLVALVKAEEVTLSFPRAAMVAGKFFTSNNGNKDVIDTNGETNQYTSGDIIVRCSTVDRPADGSANGCSDRWNGQGQTQVSPDTTRSNPTQPPALTPEALDRLRDRARSDGNYFAENVNGCGVPLVGDKPGEVVFIENIGDCTYNANAVYNTLAKPGILIIGRGSIEFTGTSTFHGIVYHPNLNNRSDYVVRLHGCTSINGAIVVDGPGGVDAGSCKGNLIYNPNVFTNLKTYGTAGIVQNSFREIRTQ